MSRIRFRTEAARDVEEARAWYDANREGLGDEFVLAIERVLDIIADLPGAFPETPPPFRRALLGRFPYSVYYQVDRDVIDVVACLNTRQSPERGGEWLLLHMRAVGVRGRGNVHSDPEGVPANKRFLLTG